MKVAWGQWHGSYFSISTFLCKLCPRCKCDILVKSIFVSSAVLHNKHCYSYHFISKIIHCHYYAILNILTIINVFVIIMIMMMMMSITIHELFRTDFYSLSLRVQLIINQRWFWQSLGFGMLTHHKSDVSESYERFSAPNFSEAAVNFRVVRYWDETVLFGSHPHGTMLCVMSDTMINLPIVCLCRANMSFAALTAVNASCSPRCTHLWMYVRCVTHMTHLDVCLPVTHFSKCLCM